MCCALGGNRAADRTPPRPYYKQPDVYWLYVFLLLLLLLLLVLAAAALCDDRIRPREPYGRAIHTNEKTVEICIEKRSVGTAATAAAAL